MDFSNIFKNKTNMIIHQNGWFYSMIPIEFEELVSITYKYT